MTAHISLYDFSVKDHLALDVGSTREIHADLAEDQIPDVINTSIMNLHLSIMRIDDGLMLTTDVRSDISLECSRCLIQFPYKLVGQDEESYSQTPDAESYPISKRLTVDLTQQVVDTIVPAIPQFPLHDQGCKGLCATCGANLNTAPDHFTKNPNHLANDTLANHIRLQ